MISGDNIRVMVRAKFSRKKITAVPEKKELALFYKIGGYPVLEEAADMLYEKLMADERVNFLIAANDLKLQRAQMKLYLAESLGVPSIHGDFEEMAVSSPLLKSSMALNHFVIIINYLRQAFLDLGINANIVDEAMVCIVASRKETHRNLSIT